MREIARATTRLRRSLAADAQQLVDLEAAVGAAERLLRVVQRRAEERR
jgi:hypothetical protein